MDKQQQRQHQHQQEQHHQHKHQEHHKHQDQEHQEHQEAANVTKNTNMTRSIANALPKRTNTTIKMCVSKPHTYYTLFSIY